MSLAGMLLHCPSAGTTRKHSPVNIELKSRSNSLSFRATARLVRSVTDNLAIEFTSMPVESYTSLQALLLYHAEDPFEIGVEFPDIVPFAITNNA